MLENISVSFYFLLSFVYCKTSDSNFENHRFNNADFNNVRYTNTAFFWYGNDYYALKYAICILADSFLIFNSTLV